MAGSIEQYSASIAIACIIGSALSVYSYYLISRLDEDDEYEALCDLGERLSCTKSLQSEYVFTFSILIKSWSVPFFVVLINLFVFVFIRWWLDLINTFTLRVCSVRFHFCFFSFAAMLAVLALLHHYLEVTHFSTNPTDYTASYSTQSNRF